ncbi:hypothetical protein ACS0TY_031801 [Phlomoides rotata]
MVKGNIISTPPTNVSILEGITRKSITGIAKFLGLQLYFKMILSRICLVQDYMLIEGWRGVPGPTLS